MTLSDKEMDLEADSLPTHVVACSERYRGLWRRMSRIERILWGIAALILADAIARRFVGL